MCFKLKAVSRSLAKSIRFSRIFSFTFLVYLLLANLALLLAPNSATAAVQTGSLTAEFRSSGSGGAEVKEDCPNGQVIHEIRAEKVKWRDLDSLTQLRVICKEVQTDGSSVNSNSLELSPRGVLKGEAKSISSCKTDSSIAGVIVYKATESSYVSGLQIKCDNLPRGQQRQSGELIGLQSRFIEELNCPDTSFVTGIWVRYGDVLDSFGIRCSNIKAIAQVPISGIKLALTEKVFPYSQEVSLQSFSGGSGEGKVFISAALNTADSAGCILIGQTLTAERAGACSLTVTKLGDDLYASTSASAEFRFVKASQSIKVSLESTESFSDQLLQKLDLRIADILGEGAITYAVKDGTARGCKLSENSAEATLSADSEGSCLIFAEIAGDQNYLSARSEPLAINFKLPQGVIPAPGIPSEKSEGYDPLSEPEKFINLLVAAFALLTLAAAGTASINQGNSPSQQSSGDSEGSKEGEDEREAGEVASADLRSGSYEKGLVGKGDTSKIWQILHGPKLESSYISATEKLSAYSPLLARVIHDASYLRAMLSSIAILPLLISLFLLVQLSSNLEFAAVPASLTLLAIALFVATLDSFAGLVLGIGLFILALARGDISSLDQVMVSIGVLALLVLPALIASAVRPLRRRVTDSASLWERLTDYALATLLGGWAIEKTVGALNGLAGLQLAITDSARELGIFASLFILIRLVLEDVATYYFPDRLAKQDPNYGDVKEIQKWASTLLKLTIFTLVSSQFIGFTLQLILGALLFLLPELFKIWFEQSSRERIGVLKFILPKGAPKIVIMVIIGTLFAGWIQDLFDDQRSFAMWSFVLLALPGTFISFTKILAAPLDVDWSKTKGRVLLYRAGGVAVAATILSMYLGVDISQWVK